MDAPEASARQRAPICLVLDSDDAAQLLDVLVPALRTSADFAAMSAVLSATAQLSMQLRAEPQERPAR